MLGSSSYATTLLCMCEDEQNENHGPCEPSDGSCCPLGCQCPCANFHVLIKEIEFYESTFAEKHLYQFAEDSLYAFSFNQLIFRPPIA